MKHNDSIPGFFGGRPSAKAWWLVPCALVGLSGCQAVQPSKPIPAAAFYQHPAESPGSATDQPGALDLAPSARESVTAPPAAPTATPLLSPTTRQLSGHPTSAPASHPAASRPAHEGGTSLGKYLTLGAVLAEVNGKAIYADEVMASIAEPLHAKAMELDERGYQAAARQLIEQAITAQIGTELAYSAAQRFLSQQDKQMADAATERWRQKKITEAGGSLQLARRKARANGEDFDKMVSRQAKQFMVELYRQKKIYPRVQVTVEDMRRYYNRNRKNLYTQQAAARFLVIKIDPERSGGREAALKKIQEIRRRALAGEDFSKLAHDLDDDALLRSKGGDVGWVDKGAYRLDAVEKAAWSLEPEGISDIVEAKGAFYLVKLVALKRGRVIPFENEQVQEQINQTLRMEQVRQLVDEAEQELRDNAAVWNNPQALSITMEMAMQRYALWRGK